MPIYLRQGLVVLSLTSRTFLLRDLPFVVSSWRSGRRRTLHLTPHLLRISSFGLCGRRFFWLGFWCTPERASIVSLLDYKTLLFPIQEFEKYVVDPNAESPTSILALTSLKKGRPRMSCMPRSPSMSRTTKSARTKEFLIRTSMFLIPLRGIGSTNRRAVCTS